MSENMVRTQIYLSREIYETLKRRAEEEGLPMGQQIREAVTRYVATHEEEAVPVLAADDPIWNLLGMYDSDISDGSVNHDKYIYRRDWDDREPIP